MDLESAIASVLAIDPAAEALEFRGNWSSWGDLAVASAALQRALDEVECGPGMRVGVLLRNHGAMVPVLLGLFSSKRCLASLNAGSPDAKLALDIVDAAAPVLVAMADDWKRDALLDAARQTGAAILSLEHDGVRVLDQGGSSNPERRLAEGVAIEMLSSGTTGKPKRIPLAYHNFEKALASAASYEKDRTPGTPLRLRSGVQIVTAPLAHVSGITGVMNNVLAGRKICLIERFTVTAFRDAVVRFRPKVAGAPPAALKMIMDADIPCEDFSSLVAFRTGTAPLDPALADAFHERYGIPVLQNYGATEFAGGAAGWTLEDFKAFWSTKRGSVGRLNKDVEAHTVDPETGARLPAGEVGLLELRAPNIGDGKSWTRTNDLAVVDADRFLWIKGRHDGAIIRGGFKILADDILKPLEAHPAVREAAVVGLRDERLGEVPVAVWIARNGAETPSEYELIAWLRERLMPYQTPAMIKRVDEIPRTPSLKADLAAVRALFEGPAQFVE